MTYPNISKEKKSHEIPTFDEKIGGRCHRDHKREIHMNSREEESETLHLLQWALTWVYNGGLSTKSNT
jgi:hypothetical protein